MPVLIPELPEDAEDGFGAAFERPRRRKQLPGDEKTSRSLGGGPHAATIDGR